LLCQLVTGHAPFACGTTYETIRLLLETEPRQPRLWNRKIDRDFSTICLKCLEKDPQRRYSSALVLGEDLKRWLKDEPIRAALIPLSIALLAAIGTLVWNRAPEHASAGIAVLPLESLDGDKADAAFADGVHGEILSSLAESRT
jgi:serine/threonine protein kinase